MRFSFSDLTFENFQPYIQLQEKSISAYEWTQVDTVVLSDREQIQIQEITSHLINHDTALMNEATIWARGIYPLLLLAEDADIEAWAEVPLEAKFPQFELSGIVDGVLGRSIAGRVESPFLIVVEAKKGIEAKNPVFQLYGEVLAAAHINWKQSQKNTQTLFGCYTIGDTWKFLKAEVEAIDTERPILRIEYSREYVEKLEAMTIFKILKKIVAAYLNQADSLAFPNAGSKTSSDDRC